MKKSVIIADDEPSAREYLERLLQNRSDIELKAKLRNGNEVIEFCRTLKPDIILLDIEMPGLDGMSVARKLSGSLTKSVLIFVTAYDQYAIEAFRQAAVGYLLKPFDEQELNEVLNRALRQLETLQKADFNKQIEALWDQMEKQSSTSIDFFEIKEKGLIKKVMIDELLYLESESEYVKLVTRKKTYIQRLSLKVLEDQLPNAFHRIHRTFILNDRHVVSWKYSNESFSFTMTDDRVLRSSRSFNQSIKDWLQ